MRKIGLFGGTFDPPHMGHIKVADTVLNQLKLDEVWFIPTFQPPHKSDAIANPEDRLEMLKLIIQENKQFSISTIEYDLKGKSYTYETIKTLKRLHPDDQFYFIIGGDMVDDLPHWYNINELKKIVQFVGVKREGFEQINTKDVFMVEMETISVSSSMIREKLKNHKTPYGVPGNVLEYIRENHLYED